MAEGDIAHIDHVKAGIDKSRHGAIQEIHHDLAGGRRFEIVIAHGRRRVYDDDRQAGGGEIEGYPLGEEFRTFVGAAHHPDRDGTVFIANAAFGNSDAANGAGIDDPLDPGASGGFQYVPRSIDI